MTRVARYVIGDYSESEFLQPHIFVRRGAEGKGGGGFS